MSDLSDEIEQAAADPKRVTADGVTVEAHDLQDMIAADQHLASVRAAASAKRGFVLQKLKPPGTV